MYDKCCSYDIFYTFIRPQKMFLVFFPKRLWQAEKVNQFRRYLMKTMIFIFNKIKNYIIDESLEKSFNWKLSVTDRYKMY